jgi:16S rRNA (uracil1498-N3)-methyltransferase
MPCACSAPAHVDQSRTFARLATRVATDADLAWLVAGQIAFIAECALPTTRTHPCDDPKRIDRGEVWIWDDGGRSPSAFNDAAPDFARIAPVYASRPPRRGTRRRWWPRCHVSDQQARRPFLTTDVANDVECAIYARIGFRAENDDCHFDSSIPGREAGGPRFSSRSTCRRRRPGRSSMPAAVAHHAARRAARGGRALTLFTGAGGEFAGRSSWTNAGSPHRCVRSCRESPRDHSRGTLPPTRWTTQAPAVLGVAAIAPLITARSAPLPTGLRGDKRLAHWRQIAIAACEQCGRNRFPAVAAPQPLADWLAAWSGAGFMLAPDAASPLASLPQPPASFTVLIGPEGGLAPLEIDAARARGFQAVRVGPRLLRTETAGVVALAALQTLWGDLR